MTTTLSIDAGLHGLGCGLFDGAELIAAWYASPGGYGRGPARWRAVIAAGLAPLETMAIVPDTVAIETMQIYNRASSRGDPADILEVQGVVGAISGWGSFGRSELVGYAPREWKGAVPQAVYAARVDAYLLRRGWSSRLAPHPASRHHDVCHGIGVGLHYLGLVVAGKSCYPASRPVVVAPPPLSAR